MTFERHPFAIEAAYRMAARYMDYQVRRAHEVFEGDGLRFVPGPDHPVPVRLACPLVAVAVVEVDGQMSVTVRPRAAVVADALDAAGIEVTSLAAWDATIETVILPLDYPVLVR